MANAGRRLSRHLGAYLDIAAVWRWLEARGGDNRFRGIGVTDMIPTTSILVA